jgi:hypothetical protein
MPTHAEKNRERCVLFPLKRANIAAFCLYDRAAGHHASCMGHALPTSDFRFCAALALAALAFLISNV